VLLLLAAVAVLATRTWIGLMQPQWFGSLGDPLTLRANKLSGWLTVGGVPGGNWNTVAPWANALWELLPAVLFTLGIAGWCRTAKAETRWPRLSFRWRGALAFAGVLGISAALSWGCFHSIPHVQDSIAQQFQAQLFAQGHVYAPAPPVADQLTNEFVVQDQNRWYSQYPPMQPALLAVGVWAGLPWLVNPLVGALTVLFLYRAARLAYGPSSAGVVLALCCASPFLWFMSAERMNHAAVLLFLSAALWAFAPALSRRPRALTLWQCGGGAFCLGLAISSRPLCGAAVALPMFLALLPVLFRRERGRSTFRTTTFAALGLGFCLGILPLLAFNAATTGSPLRSGYEARWGNSGWGFGTSQWGPPHTPAQGMAHTATNWDAAAKYLLEWPIPSLLPLLGLLALRRRTPMDGLLVGILVAVSAAYFPYFFQDLCFGPRFLYAAMPALILLSARGLRGWGLYLARVRRIKPRHGISVVARAALACSVVGLAVNLPLLLQWYGSGFWGTTDVLTTQVRAQQLRHALVLIQDHNFARRVRLHRLGVAERAIQGALINLDERWIDDQIAATAHLSAPLRAETLTRVLESTAADPHNNHRATRAPWQSYPGPSTNASLGFYANTPWPEQQNVIYAIDLGSDNRKLLRAFPGREVWRYAYDRTAAEFRLKQVRAQITSR
jgi:hypothetical protein